MWGRGRLAHGAATAAARRLTPAQAQSFRFVDPRMRVRPLFLTVHRWLTFGMGLLFLVVIGSGVMLVYADEIDAALNPSLFRATPGDVGVDRARDAMMRAYPGNHVANVYFPVGARRTYAGSIGATGMMAYVDPGTGRVLGTRRGSLIEATRRLHLNLFARGPGVRVVGLTGLLMLVMIVTGLYLWWPGWRKLALGFRLRRRGSASIILYDLHNLAGVLSLPVVLAVTATGIPLAFSGTTTRVARALSPRVTEPPSPPPRKSVPLDSARLSYGELVRLAEAAVPGTRPLRMGVWLDPAAPVELRLITTTFAAPDGYARVALDPYSGRVMRTIDPRTMSAARAAQHHWVYALHVGSFGPAVRVLYAVLGAAPVFLVVSGLLVWWYRRRGQVALEEKRRRLAA